MCAIASWDSSLHDSASLNRVTPANERMYMVVKAVVRLSHPASMELVLRKRIAINIYKKQSLTSLTHMLKNRIIGSVGHTLAHAPWVKLSVPHWSKMGFKRKTRTGELRGK